LLWLTDPDSAHSSTHHVPERSAVTVTCLISTILSPVHRRTVPNTFLQSDHQFPGATTITLEQNYRLTFDFFDGDEPPAVGGGAALC
jgi:hypothetical protein